MLAGVARIDITPPVGTWLVGYLDREQVSTAVADPLGATAWALRDGDTTLVLVSCELLALHPRLVGEVRRRVSAATGILPDAVWLIATHTHSGPPSEVTDESNEAERAYAATLPERIAEAAITALTRLEPVKLSVAFGHSDLGENRRHIVNGQAVMEPAPGRPLDNSLSLLRATRSDGTVLAVLAVVGCHPVTVGRDNLTVGGDYPGKLCRLIEAALGGVALFAMAASGDVNPRFGPLPDQSGAAAAADSLMGPVRVALAHAVPIDAPLARETAARDFAVAPSLVDRGPNAVPDIDHMIQVKGMDWPAIDRVMDRRHPWHPALPGNYHAQHCVPGEIAAARIGEVGLVALPFEVFSAVGATIREGSPFKATIVIGQANGALGYLAPAEEHPYGGYEIRESSLYYRTRGPLSPAATELAIATSLELLASLKEARQ